ncbi:hypothetical protein CBM2586_B10225 [Cupriavidus phytorum]|uniref:Uncharacterized protein n=1 Tax=Cupriavidus taiwanensis TaxID=164546 RepID=A0A375C8S8_9BURK|nr:hypothetical protein [Cupriavidus taiwanensis]SOY65630.1 hypothetical protein CBM2586_B10225 [Cupriavidus taiwanensis]
MTRAQEAAIARVCAHECLQKELVEALATVIGWAETQDDDINGDLEIRIQFTEDLKNARAVLAKAKEQV